MLYGDDPKDGFVKGRLFIHPEMRFRFEVPEGFQLFNNPRLVVGKGPKGALIQFDTAKRPYNKSMTDYIVKVWARDTDIRRVDRINVNGMPGATTKTQVRQKNGIFDLRLTAIKYNNLKRKQFLDDSCEKYIKFIEKD